MTVPGDILPPQIVLIVEGRGNLSLFSHDTTEFFDISLLDTDILIKFDSK